MKEHVRRVLDELCISQRWLDHEPVFTVAESMLAIAEQCPVKNLLLVEDRGERTVLVIMLGTEKLDVRRLAKQLHIRKLRFADEAVLRKALHTTPGSVSLFCLLHDGSKDVEVVLDSRLFDESEIGFHPGINASTVYIPGRCLLRVVEYTGHQVHLLES